LSHEMTEALYFRNISFSRKLDSEADVSKIQNMVKSGLISGATLILSDVTTA